MFRYRLHLDDGTDIGEAAYSDNVNVAETIMLGPARYFRVLDVVEVYEPGAKIEGLLKVAIASGTTQPPPK